MLCEVDFLQKVSLVLCLSITHTCKINILFVTLYVPFSILPVYRYENICMHRYAIVCLCACFLWNLLGIICFKVVVCVYGYEPSVYLWHHKAKVFILWGFRKFLQCIAFNIFIQTRRKLYTIAFKQKVLLLRRWIT